jgi:hypothetical protein
VLLAETLTTPAEMRRVYRQRLNLALEACQAVNLSEREIDRDVKVLLNIPEVRENCLVRRYY